MAEELKHSSKSDSEKHDSVKDNGEYEKRCYCEKCVGKYKEWCKKQKEEGCSTCKRRCYTVCEIKCKKTDVIHTHWGYHEKFEGKWEHYRAEPAPKNCEKCKKEHKDCKCEDRKD